MHANRMHMHYNGHAATTVVTPCPLYDALQFCISGVACPMLHRPSSGGESPTVGAGAPLPNAADAASTDRVEGSNLRRWLLHCRTMSDDHEEGRFHCGLCQPPGEWSQPPFALSQVGETSSYPLCPLCKVIFCHPAVQQLVEAALRATEHPKYRVRSSVAHSDGWCCDSVRPLPVPTSPTTIDHHSGDISSGSLAGDAPPPATTQQSLIPDWLLAQADAMDANDYQVIPPYFGGLEPEVTKCSESQRRDQEALHLARQYLVEGTGLHAPRLGVAYRALNAVYAVVTDLTFRVRDPYLGYKLLCDAIRRCLPPRLRCFFTYEAHRLGTMVYAWSLVSSLECEMSLRAAVRASGGTVRRLVSLGSGTGYVEHLFAETIVRDRLRLSPTATTTTEAASSSVSSPSVAARKPTPNSTHPSPLWDRRDASIAHVSVFAIDETVVTRLARFSCIVSTGKPATLSTLGPSLADACLLLCWPPFGGPSVPDVRMAADATLNFLSLGGKYLIYVGDVASTGDPAFHVLLNQRFAPLKLPSTVHDGSAVTDKGVTPTTTTPLACGYGFSRLEIRRWCPQEMGLVFAGADSIAVYVALPQPPF